jgi:hypothetical protein
MKRPETKVIMGVLLGFFLWYFVFLSDFLFSFWYRVTAGSFILALYALSFMKKGILGTPSLKSLLLASLQLYSCMRAPHLTSP